MSEKHQTHYYEDGDILLIAERTKFLVHKIVLSLSSEFFKDLFKLSKPSTNESLKFIENQPHPTIEMNGETSESVERMLSFIYPITYIEISWNNVEDLLRLADKFIINKLIEACSTFLLENFQEEVFLSFLLAERYSLPTEFKEISKLILDDLDKYKSHSDYTQLSEKTRMKLLDTWFNYFSFLNKLILDYKNQRIPDYTNVKKCLDSYATTAILKPSELTRLIKTNNSLGCLRKDLEKLAKNYKPLKCKQSDENKLYIFVELS